MSCCSRFFVTALMTVAVAGCQSHQVASPDGSSAAAASTPSAEATKKQRFDQFVRRFQSAIGNAAMDANSEGLTGEVRLVVQIDRSNAVVSCDTHATGLFSVNPRLAELSKAACWSAVFPPVPPERFDQDGNVKIVAPLIFLSMSERQRLSMQGRYQQAAQARYFAERTLMKSPPDSIGVVTFEYLTDKQGKVQECVVNLERHLDRLDAFKYDNALQARLTEQCKHLDLAQMPGFAVDATGVARGTVFFNYSPWMGGAHAR